MNDAWSTAVTVIRLGRGRWVRHGGARRRPERLLELWDFEGCPYCRKVREALTELDLDWICHPCARGSGHRRDTPTTGGPPLDTFGSMLASAVRPRGIRTPCGDRAQPPQRPLLYQSEGCPYSRKVRERLCELDLDYQIINVGKRSPRREELTRRGGKPQVPYLVDPNGDVEMYESEDIVRYLDATYGR